MVLPKEGNAKLEKTKSKVDLSSGGCGIKKLNYTQCALSFVEMSRSISSTVLRV